LGQRTQVVGATGADTVSYVFDNAGRLTSTTSAGKTLSYLNDPAGNRTRITWPDAFYATTSFDALNRPLAIQENGTVALASHAYDDLSRRQTITLGNGTTTGYSYSLQGTLSGLAHNLAGTAQDINYGYTRNQAQEITSSSWNNDLYQWTGATKPNGTINYTSNGLNQYTAVTSIGQSSATPAHDANGNLITASHWGYTYDSDNRLKTAVSTDLATSVNASLTYDAQGRLRQTQINVGGTNSLGNLLYDGVDLVAEYDGANALQRRYVHGPGVDEPLVWYEGASTTNKSWLYADHLGSIVATANASGTSSNINTYGPFGETAQTTPDNNRFGYTGQQQLKGLGLDYCKARVYSPALGRFLQTDPIGYADDLNLYGYVGNNALNANDPDGLAANWLKGAVLSGGKVVDDLVTGGFGQTASQAFGAGNFGEGMLYTGAGVAFGAMNVLTLGQGTAAAGVAKLASKGVATDLKYADRVRQRALEDPVSHNFPYSFDKGILSTTPIPKNNGYTMCQQPGAMTGKSYIDGVTGSRVQTYKDGVFEIGVTKDGIIDLRFFRPNP
jgi:RHS repeat-associated protein